MFTSIVAKRAFSTATKQKSTKVTVLGAAGGIGQPLSLLLKRNSQVNHLSVYDIVNAPGVAADLSHINTNAVRNPLGAPPMGESFDLPARSLSVTGHGPENNGLETALEGSDIVVIPAGIPRKPDMTRDDLFSTNASIVRDLATAIAKYALQLKHSPKAHVLIISNPVNSTVPIVAEVLKLHGVFDPKRLFGVTSLDVIRASRFVSELKDTDGSKTKITVVGGHSGVTIVPLLSQSSHSFTEDEIKALTHRIQFGGDEVVKAKNGTGSATLSMAFAGAKFANALISAASGKKTVTEPTYVQSPLFADEGIEFFASNVDLGPNGVEKIHGLGELSPYEESLIAAAIPELRDNIEKGKKFVA
ncbi:malate dehydrogenase, NAD-dependent [Jimgerdemannia flammicorona]|uniref:malate dehydrogenase n=1 Tax=Jimgerdemannia flammicorona TaxID=994334 RepID=A0A433QZX9_9FUNG|nr:malate dehydrogenase, NAD-dependent [Jimgerdemannia flammicorona]